MVIPILLLLKVTVTSCNAGFSAFMIDGTVLHIPGRRSTRWPAHWSSVYLSILTSSTTPYTHNSMQLALLESFNTSSFHTHADGQEEFCVVTCVAAWLSAWLTHRPDSYQKLI